MQNVHMDVNDQLKFHVFKTEILILSPIPIHVPWKAKFYFKAFIGAVLWVWNAILTI